MLVGTALLCLSLVVLSVASMVPCSVLLDDNVELAPLFELDTESGLVDGKSWPHFDPSLHIFFASTFSLPVSLTNLF